MFSNIRTISERISKVEHRCRQWASWYCEISWLNTRKVRKKSCTKHYMKHGNRKFELFPARNVQNKCSTADSAQKNVLTVSCAQLLYESDEDA